MQQQQQPQQAQYQIGQQKQNGTMQEPPSIITTKDEKYVKDALAWELLAMKKCNHFAAECQDQQIKDAINAAGKMHQKHYEYLMNHVTPEKGLKNS